MNTLLSTSMNTCTLKLADPPESAWAYPTIVLYSTSETIALVLQIPQECMTSLMSDKDYILRVWISSVGCQRVPIAELSAIPITVAAKSIPPQSLILRPHPQGEKVWRHEPESLGTLKHCNCKCKVQIENESHHVVRTMSPVKCFTSFF